MATDALTMKIREGGRMVNAVVLLATGVDGDGHRELLGMRVSTSETGPAWNEFFADLVARGNDRVRLDTRDAHQGLAEAVAANVPGAAWHRCRTHYALNLMAVTPKAMRPAVKAMLHSVYNQPDAPARHAQFDRLLDHVGDRHPEVHDRLDAARGVGADTMPVLPPEPPQDHAALPHHPGRGPTLGALPSVTAGRGRIDTT